MRLLPSLFVLLFTFSAYSQAAAQFIEVAIKEDVQLKVLSAKMSLSVYSEEAQMAEIFESENEDTYGESVEDEYYSVEDMKPAERRRYEEEQQEREALNREREAILAQKVNDFIPYTIQELIATLRANNIDFEIQELAMSDNYEEWLELIELGVRTDTQLVVILHSEAAHKQLTDLISSLPIDSEIIDVTFDSVDSQMIALAPKMAERAKKQAEGLALSVGKKLGAILQVSNVYPGFSPALLDAQFQQAMLRNQSELSASTTFQATKPSYIEVIYRFELKD